MATRPLEELADVRYSQQRFHRAGEIYEQALRLDDRAARVSYKLALARYRDGRADAALTSARRRAAPRRPDDRRLLSSGAVFSRAAPAGRGAARPRKGGRAVARPDRRARRAGGPATARSAAAATSSSSCRCSPAWIATTSNARSRSAWRTPNGRPTRGKRAAKRAGQADLAVLTLGSALERTPDQPQIYSALGRVWLDIAQARGRRRGAEQGARGARARGLEQHRDQRSADAVWPRAAPERPQRSRRTHAAAGDRALPRRSGGVPLLCRRGRTAEPSRRRAPGARSNTARSSATTTGLPAGPRGLRRSR